MKKLIYVLAVILAVAGLVGCDVFGLLYAPRVEYVVTGASSNNRASIKYHDYKAKKVVSADNVQSNYWSSGDEKISTSDCPFIAYISVANNSYNNGNSNLYVEIKVDGKGVTSTNVAPSSSQVLTYVVE